MSDSKAGCGSIIGFIFLILAIYILSQHWTSPPKYDSTSNPPEQQTFINKGPSEKELALGKVKITAFRWRTGGFGTVMLADFTIKNNNDFDIKDIAIKCTDYAKSGTIIDYNDRIIYDVIKAGQTRTFRNFNMGLVHNQAEKSFAKITDLVILK
ncbi:MAG: hypothetical protein ABSC45_08370 [Desulfobaccales bacterium]|jgi:hypothetical protein